VWAVGNIMAYTIDGGVEGTHAVSLRPVAPVDELVDVFYDVRYKRVFSTKARPLNEKLKQHT
jgi:hypothetical protein